MTMAMAEYHRARLSKDKSYDGRFYFGVKTTGIFCRPSCPAPIAKEQNVVYFESPFEALEQAFIPCYRCRPDVSLDYCYQNIEANQVVNRAVSLIQDGYLDNHSVSDLAEVFGVTDRHLRKMFSSNLGTSPNNLAIYHRALFAKKLLLQTKCPVTEVAFAAGFSSIRQFNEVMKKRFGRPPSEIRKLNKTAHQGGLKIHYPNTFRFGYFLEQVSKRAVSGVELVSGGRYCSTFRDMNGSGWFELVDVPSKHYLELKIHSDNLQSHMAIYNQVRRMLDLNSDLSIITAHITDQRQLCLAGDPTCLPHIPAAFDPFSLLCLAILRQDADQAAARQQLAEIAVLANLPCIGSVEPALNLLFPTPSELLELDLTESSIPLHLCHQLKLVAKAINDGSLSLSFTQSFNQFSDSLMKVADLTAQLIGYTALFGLGMKDCWLDIPADNQLLAGNDISCNGNKWAPYRSYASLYQAIERLV